MDVTSIHCVSYVESFAAHPWQADLRHAVSKGWHEHVYIWHPRLRLTSCIRIWQLQFESLRAHPCLLEPLSHHSPCLHRFVRYVVLKRSAEECLRSMRKAAHDSGTTNCRIWPPPGGYGGRKGCGPVPRCCTGWDCGTRPLGCLSRNESCRGTGIRANAHSLDANGMLCGSTL